MTAEHADRLSQRHSPPPSPKLIDLTSGFDSGVRRRTTALIHAALEAILSLDRVNRCYAEYRKTLEASKGPRDIFEVR
jgi:hypothetical protein